MWLQSRHLPELQSSEHVKLDWGRWVCFQDGAPTRLLAEDLSTPPWKPLHRAAWVCSQHGSCLSSDPGKEWKGSYSASCDLGSEAIHHYFHHILFIRSKSLHPVHTQRKGSKSHLLKRGVSTNFGVYFQTVSPLYPSSSPDDPDRW